MPFISLDLESIDLEDAHYVIDFFRAESISQSQPAAYVSDHIFFHFLPVRLMALLLHMIHHGLNKKQPIVHPQRHLHCLKKEAAEYYT